MASNSVVWMTCTNREVISRCKSLNEHGRKGALLSSALMFENNHHAEGELEADPSVSSITSQQQCRKNIENIDKLVLGLPGRQTRTWNNGSDKLKLKLGKLQASLGYQFGYPKGTIESFVGHSSIGLQRPPAILI